MVLFISIHALLAESDHWYHISKNAAIGFLSTLSLRRATRLWIMLYSCPGNFYPRSPCGERLYSRLLFGRHAAISIHALLAESDRLIFRGDIFDTYFYPRSPCGERPKVRVIHHDKPRFLSTLSLRRATSTTCKCRRAYRKFLSTLSLRRATHRYRFQKQIFAISIHALLAESDVPRHGI